MKAISLLEPWAALMAIGAKHVETRSWATSYRGPLVIHASKKWTRELAAYAASYAFQTKLLEAGWPCDQTLPRGVILAVVDLVDCLPTQKVYATLSRLELLFGDYTPGRSAWITENPRLITQRPASGRQGLFDVPAPHLETLP